MTDDRPTSFGETYSNGFQRRAVECLLEEGFLVKTDENTEIEVYGTEDDDISALWADIEPYEISYVTGCSRDLFAFKATLRADWTDVDFDNEPYQEDNNE